MRLIILETWTGDLYALCSEFCATALVRYRTEPDYSLKPADGPQPDVRFGCWWCGGDLTEGVTWLPASTPD